MKPIGSKLQARVRIGIGAFGLASVVFFYAVAATAVGTRRFVLDSGDDFEGGDLSAVAVDESGVVRAGFDLGQIPVDVATVIWCALDRGDQSVLLGTGNEGKILELRDGRIRVVAETGAMVVTSMVDTWGGEIVVGALPGGKLRKFSGGRLTDWVTLPNADDIWQLAFDRKRGVLYAATGPEGKLYRIDRDGHATVEMDVPEPHILSVAVAPDGSVVFGTSDKARLYRTTGAGRATVLYDFERTEVRGVAVADDGQIYAIANDIKTTSSSVAAHRSSSTKNGPESSTTKLKGKGMLLRIGTDLVPEVLLDDDDEHFTSLALDDRGHPYVGTGVEGRLMTVGEPRRSVIVADTDERQVTALLLTGRLRLVLTSDPAVVHPVRGQGGTNSVWTSKVFDANLRAQFGHLDWESTGPLMLSTRTGNTSEPDDTWSAWSAPLRAPGPITSPKGRFIQVRASWALDGAAALSRVEIPFVTDNQRAVVTRIDADVPSRKKSTSGIVASGGPITEHPSPDVNLDWTVDNPDKDTLRFRLYYRMIGTTVWRDLLPADEVLTKSSYKWDTSTLPEGRYRVRVVASDLPANPPDRATSDELVSGVVLVDNTPPRLVDLTVKGRRLRGRAVDGLGPIQRIEVTLAGKNDWVPLRPTDSVFDQASEAFDVDLSGIIPSGRQLLTVRAYDSANNSVVRSVQAF